MDGQAQVPAGAFVPILLVIVALALLIVVAMVRVSRAVLAAAEKEPGAPFWPRGDARAARWGAVYLLLWAGLIAAYLYLFEVLGGQTRRNFALLALVVTTWFAAHGVLLWFARAIIRANQRDAARAGGRAGAFRVEEPPEAKAEADVLPASSEKPRPASRGWRTGFRNAFALARNVLLILLIVALAELVPPIKAAEAWLQVHQRSGLAITLTLAALGFVLLMGGAIHMVLTGGRPMSRREIEEFQRRSRERSMGPALWRRAAVRTAGTAVGAQGEDSASFAEVKEAWRLRAWRFSPRWRRFFAMMAGAALMLFGLFGLAIVLAPAGIKIVFAAALVYAVVMTAIGFARA